MSYTFRVIFSGPCAYMPNIVEGEEPGQAKSWSVILPDIRKGLPAEETADGVGVDRHLAVVQFPKAKFDTSMPPDIDVTVRDPEGDSKDFGLFLLDGHRITFDIPGAADLEVLDQEIDLEDMANQDAVSGFLNSKDPNDLRRRSMQWMPAMSWLRKELQWFGREGIGYFRKGNDLGFPKKGAIAGHVLLKHGLLGTHEIDTLSTGNLPEVTIWELRPIGARVDTGIRKQALANSIALEAHNLEAPITIIVAFSSTVQKTLTLKPEHCTGEVEIYIKNRELEEIFLPRRFAEFEPHPVDVDFRFLYTQAKNYVPESKDYPLPHRVEGGGGGNEVGTCGGVRFSGLSSKHQKIVNGW